MNCRLCGTVLTVLPNGALGCLACHPGIYNRIYRIVKEDERFGEPVDVRNPRKREIGNDEALLDFGRRRWETSKKK